MFCEPFNMTISINISFIASFKYILSSVGEPELPCPYLIKYSPGILKKKTNVLDTFYTNKIFNVE